MSGYGLRDTQKNQKDNGKRSERTHVADRPYPDGESNQLSYDGESFPGPAAGLREGSRGEGEPVQSDDENPAGALGEVGELDAARASTFE